MTRRTRENLVYGGIALGSVLFLVWLIPAFTPEYPGYGVPAELMPNVAVGAILALSVLSLVRNLLLHRAEKKRDPTIAEQIPEDDRVHLVHLVTFMVLCVLLMPAMQWIGFIPAGIVFMLIIQFLCGQRKPVAAVVTALATVGIVYAIMNHGLGVPMP